MSAQTPTVSDGDSGAQSAESQAQSPADLHTFPAWFQWLRDHWFMTFLIVAEMYLLATGGSEGWVPQLDNINTWGWYHGAGVVLFFLACGATAGIALGLSLAASHAFAGRQYVRGTFTFLGAFFFALLEVIINLSERSWNLRPSPFDQWVLMVLHAPTNLPFTPTLLASSLLLPATIFVYGWARTPKAKKEIRSVEEIRAEAAAREAEDEARRQRKLADEEMKRRQKLIRDGQLTLADLQRQEAEERARLAAMNAPDPALTTDDDDDADATDDAFGAPASPSTPLTFPVGIPANYWQAKDVMRYARERYERTMTADAARGLVQNTKGAVQYKNVAGQPWAAPRTTLKRAVDRQYAVAATVNE